MALCIVGLWVMTWGREDSSPSLPSPHRGKRYWEMEVTYKHISPLSQLSCWKRKGILNSLPTCSQESLQAAARITFPSHPIPETEQRSVFCVWERTGWSSYIYFLYALPSCLLMMGWLQWLFALEGLLQVPARLMDLVCTRSLLFYQLNFILKQVGRIVNYVVSFIFLYRALSVHDT